MRGEYQFAKYIATIPGIGTASWVDGMVGSEGT